MVPSMALGTHNMHAIYIAYHSQEGGSRSNWGAAVGWVGSRIDYDRAYAAML